MLSDFKLDSHIKKNIPSTFSPILSIILCNHHSFSLISVLICDNQDSNMRDILGPRFLVQRGCTYDKVEYHTAILPGCPIEANPVFTYPVALSCHCSACRTDTDECAHRASMDGTKCTKPVRRIYPYPGHSNYVIPFWLTCSCSHNVCFSCGSAEHQCSEKRQALSFTVRSVLSVPFPIVPAF